MGVVFPESFGMRIGLCLCLSVVFGLPSVPMIKDPGAHLPHPDPKVFAPAASHTTSKYAIGGIEEQTSCGSGCSGYGTCVQGKCRCEPGYSGEFCERAICLRNCGNHGQCVDGACVCHPGWQGSDCSTDTCPSHCHFHGSCHDGTCECATGFSGQACEIEETHKDETTNPETTNRIALAEALMNEEMLNDENFLKPAYVGDDVLLQASAGLTQ
eukprot:c8730_g1_i1.p1 GENE.c8730_g1_i1~~c8730_g1_i1.p1  ORF type:complete len:213 (+),score=21.53 c8730_g1_i1:2-640(+)